VALGFSASDPNGNIGNGSSPPSVMNTDDGLITFVGGGRYDSGATLGLPGTTDGGPVNRYSAGTFEFTAAPEPGTLVLFGVAGAAGLLLRKRGLATNLRKL
jgi:hypothetical protein